MVLAVYDFALREFGEVGQDAGLIFRHDIDVVGLRREDHLPHYGSGRGEPRRPLPVLLEDHRVAPLRDKAFRHTEDVFDAAIDDGDGGAEEDEFHLWERRLERYYGTTSYKQADGSSRKSNRHRPIRSKPIAR